MKGRRAPARQWPSPSGFLTGVRFNLLLGVFVILASVLVATGGLTLIQRVFSPLQVNQGEAINVEFSRILFKSGSLYADPTNGPYLHAAYPPLFPILQGVLSFLIPGIWLPGRLLAFAGYLGCAILLALWGWRRWGKYPSIALALLFLLSPTWATWGSMVRVDTFMILLGFGAFLLLSHEETSGAKDGEKRKWLVAAGGAAALALLCKQNAVLLVAAYGLSCLIQKKWRPLFLFASVALFPSLLVFLYLQWSSHGFYYRETVSWVSYGYQPELLAYYIKNSFGPECGWLLALVGVTWWFKKTPLLIRCQIAFVFLSLLGLGRKTSAENYYLEFILYGLFILGEGWLVGSRTGSRGSRREVGGEVRESARFFLLATVILGFVFFNLRPWPASPSGDEIRMKEAMLRIYRSPGEHLALDLDLPLLAGKSLWIQPAEYTALVGKGHWLVEPLLKDIRAKKFATIELYDLPRQYLLPQVVVDEIEKSYQIHAKEFGRKWYVPK